MNFKNILCCLLVSFLFMNCYIEPELSENSSVVPTIKNHNELDQWIEDNFVKPYNIAVQYRWDSRIVDKTGNHLTPADPTKVKAFLEALKYLWIDVFSDEKIGGKDFLTRYGPIRIVLYGNNHTEIYGNEPPLQMPLYNVNGFDPLNSTSVYQMLRGILHSYARVLDNYKSFDRDAFKALNPSRYTREFLEPNPGLKFAIGGLTEVGYWSRVAIVSVNHDFMETFSILGSNTISSINQLTSPPRYNNPNNKIRGWEVLAAKRDFVDNYLQDNFGINMARLRLINLAQMKVFIEEKKLEKKKAEEEALANQTANQNP